MKKYPLGVQIWIVFAMMAAAISLLMILIVPTTLRTFFTHQIYLTIEDAQNVIVSRGLNVAQDTPINRSQEKQNIRTVQHMIITANGKIFRRIDLPPPLILTIRNQAMAQQNEKQQYVQKVKNENIFYVIRKVNINNQSFFLFSYMWDTYQKQLVHALYTKMLMLIVIILLISWIPSIWLVRSVSKPIVQIVNRVKRIANRDWHEPIIMNRSDEIGQLASSIEWMRKKLVKKDEMQQSFMQHISHELKTPVMVIRSYAEAIGDGIYPKGDLTGSVKVIDEEGERLEKRIHDLLYLTKLDYMNEQAANREKFHFDTLIEHVIDRLRWKKKELNWKLTLIPIEIQGDGEQWGVAIENLLDNQIRYAASTIQVSMDVEESTPSITIVKLRIWNDGPMISEERKESFFQPFNKGQQGKFGLGLAIVKRIADFHQSKVFVQNEEEGVAFYLEIPVNP